MESSASTKQTAADPGTAKDGAIRPFSIEVPQEDLDELRRRITATRWPSKELVDDRSQGVQLATIQALSRYWTMDYDWRACEAKLNALPQFTTEIDGVDIHFIHVKSDARGRVAADHDPRLARLGHRAARDRRPAHRPDRARRQRRGRVRPGAAVGPRVRLLGRAERARLVRRPRRGGLGGADATPRLHPLRRPGRRRGSRGHRRDGAPGTRGAARHPHNLFVPGLAGIADAASRGIPRRNARRHDAGATFRATGFGYFLEQATRPQTIGYALLDSPVALAAWMLDHDTDSYYKIAERVRRGQAARAISPGSTSSTTSRPTG